jgi:integrase/recombinase XerC
MSVWAWSALVILVALCGVGVAVLQDASRRLDDGMQRINEQIDRQRSAAIGSHVAGVGGPHPVWHHRPPRRTEGEVAHDPLRAARATGIRRIVESMTNIENSSWVAPIEHWVEWMCAADRPATTQYLRTYQVRRFARESGLGPWAVTLGDLVAWLGAQKWGAETKRSYRAALRAFFKWAHITGRIQANPAGLLPPIKTPIRKPRPTSEAVLAAALSAADPRVRLMVLLAAREGLRRGEIAQVHSRDVERDLFNGWTLRVHGKGARERVLPLCDEVRVLLQAAPAGYVFPGQIAGHLSPSYVGKLVSAVLGAGSTTHCLRHRFGTICYAGGRDLLAVQALLGHSKPETTKLYVLIPDASLREAIQWAA